MSFDSRSRERLEALGRTLPEKLPSPAPRQPPAPAPSSEVRARHRVEREQDPEALFHALMEASPDGSVPPHLLDRLRSLEQPGPPLSGPRDAAQPGGQATPSPRREAGRRANQAAGSAAAHRAGGSDRDLYEAFDDLLRAENDEEPEPPPTRRQSDPRLLPRPTLRSPRGD